MGKRKKKLGDSSLDKSNLGKSRTRMRSVTARPKPPRKFGRATAPGSLVKGWHVTSGRKKKLKKMTRVNFTKLFTGKMGRGFGSIFKPRKSSGRKLTNIFKDTKLKRGLGAGARPERGIGSASIGTARFKGGIFSSILRGRGAEEFGLSYNIPDLPGFSDLPPIFLEARVLLAVWRYVRAKSRNIEARRTTQHQKEQISQSEPGLSILGQLGSLEFSIWRQRTRAEVVRQAREDLAELLNKPAADYLLDVVDSRRSIPDASVLRLASSIRKGREDPVTRQRREGLTSFLSESAANDLLRPDISEREEAELLAQCELDRFSDRFWREIAAARAVLYDETMSEAQRSRFDIGVEDALAAREAEEISRMFTTDADIINQYISGRINQDQSAYRGAQKQLRTRFGEELAKRILRWTTGETRVPGNLTRIKGLENSPPQLREAIIKGREQLEDLKGVYDKIDTAAEDEKARREHEALSDLYD